MSVENFITTVSWPAIKELVANSVPFHEWPREDDDEDPIYTAQYSENYSVKTESSFHELYEAVRGELVEDQRDLCDRFYSMLHRYEYKTAEITPLPANLKRLPLDLEPDGNRDGDVVGIMSPTTVRELKSLIDKIDFGEIEKLLNLLYENPSNWQNSNRIPNKTKSPLLAKNWKHQTALEEFDRYCRFFNVGDAMEHAKIWVAQVCSATDGDALLLTCSY